MKTTELDTDLHISGQITQDDIKSAAKKGIKTIINVRPDGEQEGDYMTAREASDIASEHGVNYCHIPVVPDQISDQNVADFGKVLAELPRPILAHCGSGKRVSVLWALSNNGSLSADERIEKAGEAGHDLSALKPRLG
ncbi:MAG: TIGR01244 family phosphatase [Rhizobiales bacterium]|nr:TIGR01244 family phosphatase [Hyphomicrobiales bacterium]